MIDGQALTYRFLIFLYHVLYLSIFLFCLSLYSPSLSHILYSSLALTTQHFKGIKILSHHCSNHYKSSVTTYRFPGVHLVHVGLELSLPLFQERRLVPGVVHVGVVLTQPLTAWTGRGCSSGNSRKRGGGSGNRRVTGGGVMIDEMTPPTFPTYMTVVVEA